MKNSLDTQLYEERFGFKERNSSFWFYVVLLAVLVLFTTIVGYFSFCFYGVTVSGDSMKQTLFSGENLLMRYTDDLYKADYGDIIIVSVEGYDEFVGTDTKFLIKRLIAKEGDKVRCSYGQVEVWYAGDDKWTSLDEPYAYYPNELAKYGYSFSEYTVGEGEIFFLGDNRTNSLDSRYKEPYGSRLDCLYKEEDIYGVVPQWAVDHQKILNVLFFRGSMETGNE
ncbi:MAG: signal peptidase I [Clostridia bacterium]|nr:signal peptidase I [Clostridia bacterium]